MNSKILKFIEGFKEGQKRFGEPLGVIINSIILSVVYFIGVGITSVIAKIANKHFLELNKETNVKTYWEELNLTKRPMEEYYKQF